MVVCNNYNFIFLRVPKNASTSLATWFVQNCCNENDRYTLIHDSGIQNNNIPTTVIENNLMDYHFIHMTLQELVTHDIVDSKEVYDKTVISVIRDPIERQLSLFLFRSGDKTPTTFRNTFRKGYHNNDVNNGILQTDYPKLFGENVGVFWLYEDVSKKLEEFRKDRNIDARSSLRTYKRTFLPVKGMINYFYDDYTREAVLDYYEPDYKQYMEMKHSS